MLIDAMPKDLKERTLRYMRAYFDLCSEEYWLRQKGYIRTDFWKLWSSGMKVAFSKEAFKQAWQIISKDTVFDLDFVDYVTSNMK